MNELEIQFTSKARYYTLGSQESKTLVYVLHGYGQLAKLFIQKFKSLENEHYIVAPEGLHRFYLEGHSGRVGASWMSKENRLTDIKNYLSYLNKLHFEIKGNSYERIVILGFSQGVATAFRWIADGKVKPNTFLIASGMIPPDVSIEANQSIFSNMDIAYITGDNDPFKDEKEVRDFLKQFEKWGISLQQRVFKGGHIIDLESIKSLLLA
ncbi:MAG: alpha/beta hydrolase [Bacteroidia bacterium]